MTMNKRGSYSVNKRSKSSKLHMFIVVLGVGWFAYFVFTSNLGASNESVEPFNIQTESQSPPIKTYDLSTIEFPPEGQAAIGTLVNGPLVSSSGSEYQAPMASMTKVITALAILEKAPMSSGDPGDTITLSLKDEQYYHDYLAVLGTITPVTAGLSMTQYEALQAMLLPSSNNISDTMVDHFFGSQEEFIIYANAMLDRYGLKNTRVADASGFSPSSVSTPSEMIIIGQKALQNEVIADIVSKETANLEVSGEVPNYNPLILDPGITGIKPGATDEAGLCLLFSADALNNAGEKVTVIGVVMGVTDRSIYVDGSRSMVGEARELILAQ